MNLIYVCKLQWPRDFHFCLNITERLRPLAKFTTKYDRCVLASILLVLSALFSVIIDVKKIAVKITGVEREIHLNARSEIKCLPNIILVKPTVFNIGFFVFSKNWLIGGILVYPLKIKTTNTLANKD